MVTWEALDALSRQLELCTIDASTRVLLLLDADISADRAALLRVAITRTGAEAAEVRILRNTTPALLEDLCASADVIVTTAGAAARAAADDHCQVLELLDLAPQHFPPHANLGRRIEQLTNRVTAGSTLHVRDDHGTDLQIALASAAVSSDDGVLSTGETDLASDAVFPAGWLRVEPAKDTVQGTLVLMPGDTNQGAQRTISSPVRLLIHQDLITTIEGESADADTIRALLEYVDEPSAYGIGALTLGMNPGTQPLTPFDDRLLDGDLSRLLAGIVTISFGENLTADRPCTQTITLALADRTLAIDDLPILTNGTLEGDLAPDIYELW